MDNVKILETKDLILHEGSADDWQDLYKNLWSRPEVFTYMFSKPCADEQTSKKKTEAYAEMHKEVKTEFFVYDKSTKQAIGIAGIKEMSHGIFTVTDIAISPDFQGNGYGKQIINALVDLAFNQYNASEVLYDCFAENTASKALALACGFTYSHSAKAEFKKNGKTVILDYYRISKSTIKIGFEDIVQKFCHENGIEVTLSYDMPTGYETAYGTYDVTINTLFLNTAILEDAPRYEVLFYLFHELRHAMQYLCPMMFDERIRESIIYVILYNGICYKLVDNEWKECALPGDESYFTHAYMSLPYEMDANTFAYEMVKHICGDSAELQELFDFWIPKDSFDYEEHRKLFWRIDEKLRIIYQE